MAAGIPMPTTEENDWKPIADEAGYLTGDGVDGGWDREKAPPGEVSRFCYVLLNNTHVDSQEQVSRFCSFLELCSCGFDKLDSPFLM